ncbi:MAG: undecaprenyl diphosphate synthase family protein, partial [Salinarchaeum sp.]
SNFLPWHANGNEAAVYFCTPYWPAFSRVDFLRGLRTYQHREESWRQTRAKRAVALLRALGDVELGRARRVLSRHGETLHADEHTHAPAQLSDHEETTGD